MIAAAIENPCQRWKVEREVSVAPCFAPKDGTVQPDRASAAIGSATNLPQRRRRPERVVTP